MKKPLTKQLCSYIANMQYSDLSDEVIETTKLFIADYYASCFAGYMLNKNYNRVIKSIIFEMSGKEESTVLFSSQRIPATNAAYLNATYAHGADMDDGSRLGMGHIAAHVMSSVFALAETISVSGKDIIVAINSGYEIFCRLGASVQPGLVRRGLHATGVIGTIASGVACAKLLGLDSEGIYTALSLSAIQASGLLLITESGQACKPINAANAAKNGLLSAMMAENGIVAPNNPLESEKGWLKAVSDNVDISKITSGFDNYYSILDCYLKPYPSCRHTHCGIECALRIRKKLLEASNLSIIKKIRKIYLYIYQNAINIAGIRVPQTVEEKKFSISYSLATAIIKGSFSITDVISPNIDEEVLNMINIIEILPDDSMENPDEGIRGAKMIVFLDDGSSYEEEIPIPKGDRNNPFDWEDMKQKMKACMKDSFNENQIENIATNIKSFEAIRKYKSICQVLY